MRQEMHGRLGLAAVLSIWLIGNHSTQASITFYSTPAQFDASFIGIEKTNFSSLTPLLVSNSIYFPSGQVTVGPDTFQTTSSALYALFGCCGFGTYGVTFLSAQTYGPGPSDLEIITPGVKAFAFDYGSYIFADEPITMTLSTGDQFTIPDGEATPQFLGFSSTVPIYSITLSSYVPPFTAINGTTLDLLDVEQVPAAPIPETGSWALVLLGVSWLGLWLRTAARRGVRVLR